jgi:aryl-alcohol dehydrogenase-like predicted oxidoreductase
VSRLALGTVQFGMPYGVANRSGQVSGNEAKSMLSLALENQIDMLDTAIAYGDSESCLGKLGTKGFSLVTKLPPIPYSCNDLEEWVHQQVDASLLRLGVTKIYGLLLHRPADLLGPHAANLYQSMKLLKESGRVEKIGISIYCPSELEALIPCYQFDLIQAPFNLVDQRLLTSGWLQRLKDSNIEIHTRSAFLQGLLLMPYAEIPSKFHRWDDLWNRWHKWLSKYQVDAVHACITYVLSFPEIDRVIVGADGLEQLQSIISLSKNKLAYPIPELGCSDDKLINPANWQMDNSGLP